MPLVAPNTLHSGRVGLRLVAESDLPALLEVNSSDEVTALLPYARWRSMADAEAWFERMAGIQATGLALQFVVVDAATQRAIGTCLLFRYEEAHGRAEIGYVLGRAFWGRGLMREALQALIDWAFGTLGLRRLEAEVDVRNAASAALLRRIGFTREGLLRQRWVNRGTPCDFEMFGLLASEWPRRTPEVAAAR